MKYEDFKNLLQGVKELKAYKKGNLKPSRVFDMSISKLIKKWKKESKNV